MYFLNNLPNQELKDYFDKLNERATGFKERAGILKPIKERDTRRRFTESETGINKKQINIRFLPILL